MLLPSVKCYSLGSAVIRSLYPTGSYQPGSIGQENYVYSTPGSIHPPCSPLLLPSEVVFVIVFRGRKGGGVLFV